MKLGLGDQPVSVEVCVCVLLFFNIVLDVLGYLNLFDGRFKFDRQS